MCVRLVCVDVHGGQKRMSGPMELELQLVVSLPDVHAGNQTVHLDLQQVLFTYKSTLLNCACLFSLQ